MWESSIKSTGIGISLGAIAGALCRYFLGIWFTHIFGSTFPYSTLIINVTGCFIMGFFTTLTLIQVISVHPDVHLAVTTGFLGSYTTFSTYALDTSKLIAHSPHSPESALIYWGGTAGLGLIGLQLGIAFANLFRFNHRS